jgi:tetratricopeptide (TPR) repeat protein
VAAACYGQKRYVESELLYRKALGIMEKSLGPTHPEFAASLGNYAEALRKLKRKDEAIEVEGRVKGLLAKVND